MFSCILALSKSPFSVCPYHFPCALPHRHCHPALSSRSCPRAGEARPAGGPKNSCCWASPTHPGRCRSSSAAIPAGEGPGAGSPPRRSLGETATRETKRPGVTIKGTVFTFTVSFLCLFFLRTARAIGSIGFFEWGFFLGQDGEKIKSGKKRARIGKGGVGLEES